MSTNRWVVWCDEYGDGWCAGPYELGVDVVGMVLRHARRLDATATGWNVLETDGYADHAAQTAFDYLEKLPLQPGFVG